MQLTPAGEAALLKWVNLFPLNSPVESAAELSNGLVLAQMLDDINPNYAIPPHELDTNTSPSKWLNRKKTLEAVYKALFRYIREQCEILNTTALEEPIDFNAIAEYNDKHQTFKLLTLFLMAAVKGARIAHYVEDIMTKLDKAAQAEIAVIIQEMEDDSKGSADSSSGPTSFTYQNTPHDLALEEEIATLRKDLEEQMKKNADVFSRLERLNISYDQLQDEVIKKDTRLEALESANSGDQTSYIAGLKRQIEEQNKLIEKQEAQASADQETKESYQRELVSLRPVKARLVTTEDSLRELTQANLELERKANQVDHFKRKLERQVAVETENLRLREQLEVLEANQVAFDKVHEDNQRIKSTLKEYQKKFESYEMQIVEHSNQKHVLENELRLQNAIVEEMTERQRHDERYMRELQESLRTGTGSGIPDSPSAPATGLSLEDELEQSDDPTRNYVLEITKLKGEIIALKDSLRRSDDAALRDDLVESERVRKRIQDNLFVLTEKHAITQEQLSALISSSASEKNEAIAHTRKLYLEASQELSSLKSKLAGLENDLTSRDREIISAKADLSAVASDDLNALTTLKDTNGIITTSLENDLLVLREQHRNLTTDFEVQKTQLLETLLSKDKFMQDLASLKERTGTSQNESIESAKARSTKEAELEEQILKNEVLIEELQKKLKIAEEATPDAQKAANEAIIKNLTRENALMATAWYDLTSRLQSNHVVLQRRQDAPKSWLNKQRQLVQATGRR